MSYWYTEHKKARHPVGLFRIWSWDLTPVWSMHFPLLSFLILIWNILFSMVAIDMKKAWCCICAKSLNCCTFRLTTTSNYPKVCPQELGIISEMWPLMFQQKI